MATASDDFNRANGPLGSNWVTIYAHGCQVVSNNIAPAWAFAEYEMTAWAAASFGANQFSQGIAVTSGTYLGVAVRLTPGGNGYIWFNNGSLQRLTGGSAVGLITTATWTAGDTAKLTAIDSLLECFKNGVSIGSTTDATFATGQPGIGIINNGDGGRMDDWVGGDVTTAVERATTFIF